MEYITIFNSRVLQYLSSKFLVCDSTPWKLLVQLQAKVDLRFQSQQKRPPTGLKLQQKHTIYIFNGKNMQKRFQIIIVCISSNDLKNSNFSWARQLILNQCTVACLEARKMEWILTFKWKHRLTRWMVYNTSLTGRSVGDSLTTQNNSLPIRLLLVWF